MAPLGQLIESLGVSFHQYADDTQLYITLSPNSDCLATLTGCADAVNKWFLNNYLMLNTSKTEAILFGTSAKLRALALKECTAFTGAHPPVPFAKSIHFMGVTLDPGLSMDTRVDEIVKTCNYHLRALRHIRPALTVDVATTIACSMVLTRKDYCNSLLYGTSIVNKRRLQCIQNRTARVVLKAGRLSSATTLLQNLHWLPVESHIRYKVATLVFNALSLGQP